MSFVIKRSAEIELNMQGPFCLSGIDEVKDELGQFGLYILFDSPPLKNDDILSSDNIVYIGRAPYVGLFNRLSEHRKNIENKDAHLSQRWRTLREKINYDASNVWLITCPLEIPSYDIAYAEMYLLARHMEKFGCLPLANSNDI